jgi:hypothetical protein
MRRLRARPERAVGTRIRSALLPTRPSSGSAALTATTPVHPWIEPSTTSSRPTTHRAGRSHDVDAVGPPDAVAGQRTRFSRCSSLLHVARRLCLPSFGLQRSNSIVRTATSAARRPSAPDLRVVAERLVPHRPADSRRSSRADAPRRRTESFRFGCRQLRPEARDAVGHDALRSSGRAVGQPCAPCGRG